MGPRLLLPTRSNKGKVKWRGAVANIALEETQKSASRGTAHQDRTERWVDDKRTAVRVKPLPARSFKGKGVDHKRTAIRSETTVRPQFQRQRGWITTRWTRVETPVRSANQPKHNSPNGPLPTPPQWAGRQRINLLVRLTRVR